MKVKKLKKELKSLVELKEILKNPSPKVKVPLYTEIEVERRTIDSGDDTVKKKTLNQRMDQLEASIGKLTKIVTDGFARVDTRIDNLTNDFNSFKQEINTRLDYIVKANNLKDISNK